MDFIDRCFRHPLVISEAQVITMPFSDAFTDCLNTVRNYPSSYVFKGSIIRWEGDVYYSVTDAFSDIAQKIRNAISRSDLTVHEVSRTSAFGWGAKIVIAVQAPIDFSSINDVLGIIRGGIGSNGFSFSEKAYGFQYRPNAELVCGPYRGQPGPGQESPGNPPNPVGGGGGNGGSKFPLQGSGSTALIIAGVGLGLLLLLKR